MAGNRVNSHFQNKNGDIAAYNLLNEWRVGQKDMKTAYINICQALRRVEMSSLVNELQSKE